MSPKSVETVVIVGRDEALWLSANVLCQALKQADQLKPKIKLIAIELPSFLKQGDVTITLGAQAGFHSQLGIEERRLIAALGGSYSLGQRYNGWAKAKAPFMVGYSTTGSPYHRLDFLQLWNKGRTKGLNVPFEEFNINAAIAKSGKFFANDLDLNGFAQTDYGYHLPSQPYCEALKQLAVRRGVEVIATRHVSINCDQDIIKSLLTAENHYVEGDLYIDATGADALLLSRLSSKTESFESWKKWFPFDRMMSSFTGPIQPIPAYAQITAFRSGWTGLYPTRDFTGLNELYVGSELADEEALENASLVTSLSFNPNIYITPLNIGQKKKTWIGNCVALGDAACQFDPSESGRMAGLLIGISHLISLFPLSTQFIETQTYNRIVKTAFQRLRDYQIMQYKLNQRRDQPVWDYLRAMDIPDELAHKIEMFKARGIMPQYDDETYPDSQWVSSMVGHGVTPSAYDPLVDQISDDELIQHVQAILKFIGQQVSNMPALSECLTQGQKVTA